MQSEGNSRPYLCAIERIREKEYLNAWLVSFRQNFGVDTPKNDALNQFRNAA
jgi:hypothetical protein